MLIESSYTNSQLYSSRNIFPNGLPVYAFGLTDRSQPIRSSASSADLADVELVSQHFVTTMCNALATTVKYYKVTSSIRPKDAQRKLFVHNSASDVYVQPSNAKIQSKSGDTRTCNYCKKPRHIKAEWSALKARNEKAQRSEQKGNRKEVNFIGSSTEILLDNLNILSIENNVESEVLYTTE